LPALNRSALAGRIVSKATLALAYVILAGLVAPALFELYSHNPKPLPVDLRSAYAYLLAHAKPTDVILGAGETGRWSSSWFPFTDGYFLRSKIVTRRLETIPLRAKPRPPQPHAFPFRTVDATTGKLLDMIVVGRNKEPNLRQAAGDAFVSSCWEEVCGVEATSDLAMPLQLDDFLRRFAFLDPRDFSLLVEMHHTSN